jgi:microsomal dipeptidase-like Zn-dependent dipeptidase
MVDVAGSDFPALGSDWDGITDCSKGLDSPLGLAKLSASLRAKGLKPSTIRKIAWQNAARYLSTALCPS